MSRHFGANSYARKLIKRKKQIEIYQFLAFVEPMLELAKVPNRKGVIRYMRAAVPYYR